MHNDPARDALPVLLGRSEDGQDLYLNLAEPSHVLIQGITRSGKTNVLYTLVAQAIRKREVEVAGVDLTGLVLAPILDSRDLGGGDSS